MVLLRVSLYISNCRLILLLSINYIYLDIFYNHERNIIYINFYNESLFYFVFKFENKFL